MRASVAIIKLLLFVIWTILVVPLQLVLLLLIKGDKLYFVPWLWHTGVCFIFRIRVTSSGNIHKAPSTLYVSNHISWLDIPVIGSKLKASFVAKREVASWPVFGFLSKLQQTAFIDRSPKAALKEKNSLKNQLEGGKSLILFPEGTSSNGTEVLRFKSSLLEIAKTEKESCIQPFSISILDIDGKRATTQDDLDLYAWYGDMTLAPHLWSFAKTTGAHIHLDFLSPIEGNVNIDRKSLSNTVFNAIEESFLTYKNKK